MADWTLFAGITATLVAVLVLLSIGESLAKRAQAHAWPAADERAVGADADGAGAGHGTADPSADATSDPAEGLSSRVLLANALVVHGSIAVVLVGGAVATDVPLSSFGLPIEGGVLTSVVLGLGVGVALYGANELAVVGTEFVGFGPDEEVRAALAPDSPGEWLLLVGFTLPLGAVAEEVLFRGVLIGAMAVGFGYSELLLAVGSSILFGVAHGIQGPGGVLVTAVLGGALAAVFVATGSLVVVIVAHYVVNVLEFVLHEGLDVFD